MSALPASPPVQDGHTSMHDNDNMAVTNVKARTKARVKARVVAKVRLEQKLGLRPG